jgi:hypothetical protein
MMQRARWGGWALRAAAMLAVPAIVILAAPAIVILAAPAAWAQAPGSLVLRAEGETRSLDCTDRDVWIEGNNNRYTLRGGCRSFALRGADDAIELDLAPAAHIDVQGNNVQVLWRLVGQGVAPTISLSGQNSRVVAAEQRTPAPATLPIPATPATPATSATAPAPVEPPPPAADDGATLTFTIDDEARELDCTGRAVRITANHGLYALHGGCRSLLVHGDGNLVQAELQPGASIDLAGQQSRVDFVLLGTGAPPSPQLDGKDLAVAQMPVLGGVAQSQPVAQR